MSTRQMNAERKAKQAGYHALRGPGNDVLPTQSERLQPRETSLSLDGSGGGAPTGLAGAAAAVKAQQTAAAKAAARNAVRAGPAKLGPPVPTIAPGQVRRSRTATCAVPGDQRCTIFLLGAPTGVPGWVHQVYGTSLMGLTVQFGISSFHPSAAVHSALTASAPPSPPLMLAHIAVQVRTQVWGVLVPGLPAARDRWLTIRAP